jgi:hypothetical protein
MDTLIAKGKGAKKPLVVAGCVPQGSRDIKELDGVSIVGVQQIDRVVEIVEETLKGHEVRLLSRKTLPALDLPKVRFSFSILFYFYLVTHSITFLGHLQSYSYNLFLFPPYYVDQCIWHSVFIPPYILN